MNKVILSIALLLVSSTVFGVVKTYCDKCGTIMPQDQLQSFSVEFMVGNKHQEVSCDICGNCFEKLLKDIAKYQLNISSSGWHENIKTIDSYPRISPLYLDNRIQNDF